jgi:hypothetical protein
VRTQDLNRFESLARALSYDQELDPAEVEDVLAATRRTREELENRAQAIRGRRVPAPPGELERYQEETKIMGLHEGLVIVALPIMAMAVIAFFLFAFVIFAG